MGELTGGTAATTVAEPQTSFASASEAPPAARSAERLSRELEQRYGLREIADDEALDALDSGAATQDLILKRGGAGRSEGAAPRSDIRHEHPAPTPPFWGSRVVERIELKAALGYVNETMLFQVQWGFRKKGRSADEWKRHVDAEIRPLYRELVERCERENILHCQAVYGFWPCLSDGDDLVIYAPPTQEAPRPGGAPAVAGLKELARLTFPRQRKQPYWCLSDFWRPLSGPDAGCDVVAFHMVTAGQRVSEVAREWFARNEYQQYLFLHGLGVEVAEALAEMLHKQIRAELGAAHQDERDLQRLFKQGYRGSRFSFGYPACPALEDQAKLMTLLRPERIGVTLSEEYQLDPEQSTSAIITLHPEARYFNVR
jgi:5-methyltetrahydrofolate--homocysteine methyltransferase